jgi:hypothetical protein
LTNGDITHQGYRLKKNGYRIPAEAHLQKNLTLEKQNSKIKMAELIRGKKGWKTIRLLPMILLKQRTKQEGSEVSACNHILKLGHFTGLGEL